MSRCRDRVSYAPWPVEFMKMVAMLETKEPGVPQPDPNLSFPQYSDHLLLPSNPHRAKRPWFTRNHQRPSQTRHTATTLRPLARSYSGRAQANDID